MKKVRYYFPYKIPFEAVDWDAYLSVRRSVPFPSHSMPAEAPSGRRHCGKKRPSLPPSK